MDFPTILLIAVALAMDAFTVSVAAGVVIRKNRFRTALILAVCFGIFQAGMPLLGYLAGNAVSDGFNQAIQTAKNIVGAFPA